MSSQDSLSSIGVEWLDSNFAVYDKIQKNIHSYAELGYQETRSSAELASHLEENGFKIEWGVAEIPTAFVATYGEGSPVIGLLGEYDALKGLSQETVPYKCPVVPGGNGHGCGHNLIGTATTASAVAISKWLAEGHQGTVKFFGCPAEEGGGGKYYMTEAGCFDECDVMFHWHPAPATSVPLSTGSALLRINFNFHGVTSHAGESPWLGRSALDAVEIFDHMMNVMREHIIPEMRIHYIISNGGESPNIVPGEAQVIYYIRGPKSDVVKSVFERALKAAEGAAMGTETTMDYEIVNADHEVLVNRRLAEIILKGLDKTGCPQLDSSDEEYIKAIQHESGAKEDVSGYRFIPSNVDPPVASGGSSDVGNVSQMVPTAGLLFCVLPPGSAGLHTWQMTSIGGTTTATKCIMTVAKAFYWSALELYTNSEELKAVRDEFEAVRGKNPIFDKLMDRKPPLDYCV